MKNLLLLICCYFFLQFHTLGQLLTIEPNPDDFSIHEDSTYSPKIMKYGIDHLLDLSVNSAGKKALKISEIPASIVIITRQDIEKQGYHSLENLISHIPGFYSLGDAFFYGGTNFGVRGFASPGAFNNVMIMINGVNQMEDFSNGYSTDKINIPIQAIDRVEVIRGPMAVVYGSNAFMGSINIITSDIQSQTDTTHVISSISYGSLNTRSLFTQVKGRENNITYSFNAGFEKTDGRIFNYNDLISDSKLFTSAILVDGKTTQNQLSENAKYITFTTKFKNLSLHVDLSETQKGVLGSLPSLNFDNGWMMNILGANIQAKYSLKLHQKVKASIKYTYSLYEYNSNDLELIHPDMYGVLKVNSKAQELETNIIYDISPKINLIFGVYLRNVGTVDRFVDAPIIQLNNENSFLENSEINTLSSFTEISYKPLQKLQLTGGIRFEKTSNYQIIKQITILDSISNLPITQNVEGYNNMINIDKPQFIPRFAAIYSINRNNVLKFIYAQSKKRASYVENDNALSSENPNLTFAHMNTFEINYLTILSSKFNINTSLYSNVLDDLIHRSVTIHDNNTVSVKVDNTGKMKTIGGELTLQTEPIKPLHIETSITYQSTIDHSEDAQKLRAAFAPRFLGYLKISFDFTKNISVGIKGKYVDTMEDEYNPQTQLQYSTTAPSYLTLDANLHAKIWRGLFMNILVSNITNTKIRYVATQNTLWMDKGMLGYQRRISTTLGYKF